jgi:putative SOS response-associated peptidase YedK
MASTFGSLQRRPELDRRDHHLLNDQKRLGPIPWGFVSPTAKEPKLAPINARAETLSASPIPRPLPTPS